MDEKYSILRYCIEEPGASLMEAKPTLVLSERREILKVVSALNSESRLAIIELCQSKSRSISELCSLLDMAQSSVTTNVQILEDAGLLESVGATGRKGRQKLCYAVKDMVSINLLPKGDTEPDTLEVDMPIGLYSRVSVSPPCGIATPEKMIGYMDVPDSFHYPERAGAGILWFEKGWVEYTFPCNMPAKKAPVKLELSFEACSEALEHNLNWPSDLSVWINGILIGTWTCPGDFGGIKGQLTPGWWPIQSTQYGILKTWAITEEGSYLDGEPISPIAIGDLKLDPDSSILVRIGIKDDAKHVGGINIFGESFGNHPQSIRLRTVLTDI